MTNEMDIVKRITPSKEIMLEQLKKLMEMYGKTKEELANDITELEKKGLSLPAIINVLKGQYASASRGYRSGPRAKIAVRLFDRTGRIPTSDGTIVMRLGVMWYTNDGELQYGDIWLRDEDEMEKAEKLIIGGKYIFEMSKARNSLILHSIEPLEDNSIKVPSVFEYNPTIELSRITPKSQAVVVAYVTRRSIVNDDTVVLDITDFSVYQPVSVWLHGSLAKVALTIDIGATVLISGYVGTNESGNVYISASAIYKAKA